MAECPTLTAPPFGISAHGERRVTSPPVGEQEFLDKVVSGAEIDRVSCRYAAADEASPDLAATVTLFRQDTGSAQADIVFRSNNEAEKRMAGVDYADIPHLGDAAYATYLWEGLHVSARSRNATLTVNVGLLKETSTEIDPTNPLAPHLSPLTAAMTDLLAGLQ